MSIQAEQTVDVGTDGATDIPPPPPPGQILCACGGSWTDDADGQAAYEAHRVCAAEKAAAAVVEPVVQTIPANDPEALMAALTAILKGATA